MFEKFVQANVSNTANRWFTAIDFSDANISNVESQIYAALRNVQTPVRWVYEPIAPFSEPIDLDALLGDQLNGARDEVYYQAGRVDSLYAWINDSNNTIKTELDTIEKSVQAASDAVQNINVVSQDESKLYYWVVDNFNDLTYVDTTNTTALVDTDYGQVTLSASSQNSLTNYQVNLIKSETNGIPGCNLLAQQITFPTATQTVTNPDQAGPNVTLENANTAQLKNITDADPTTWFEIERNFITPTQNMSQKGRSYIYSESGTPQDVASVTKNYDWQATINWPDGSSDTINLAEFTDLDGKAAANDNNVNLTLELDLSATPTQLSAIKVLPYIRNNGASNVTGDIKIKVDGIWLDVALSADMSNANVVNQLESSILRRTGTQTTGSIFSIPTDRPIQTVRFSLTSAPVRVDTTYGFAHQYKDIKTHYQSTRSYIFFSSTDSWNDWGRVPVNTNPTNITTVNNPVGNILGSIGNISQILYSLGLANQATTAINQANPTSTVGTTLGDLTAISKGANSLGGTLGAIGSFLTKATPVLGVVAGAADLLQNAFSFNHTQNVTETVTGYDIFNGYRAGIGLRDIELLQTVYNNTATLISAKRVFAGPVSKIGLYVDEVIPSTWSGGNWISYYLSVDGSNWTAVQKLVDTNLTNSYTPPSPTDTVYFKAVFTGNPSDTFRTSALAHYSLMGLPAN